MLVVVSSGVAIIWSLIPIVTRDAYLIGPQGVLHNGRCRGGRSEARHRDEACLIALAAAPRFASASAARAHAARLCFQLESRIRHSTTLLSPSSSCILARK